MKLIIKLFSVSVFALALTSCGPSFVSSTKSLTTSDEATPDNEFPEEDYSKKPEGMTDGEFVTAKAIDTYCRACHGLGDLRFIYSDSPKANWEYIKAAKYTDQQSWLEAIYATLKWPNGVPPEYGSSRAGEKEWMPVGAKRQHLADAMSSGEPLVDVILETLQKEIHSIN